VLSLLRQMLQQGILEDGQTWTPETGSPQGSVLSPLLSNIYLDPLDHLLAAHGFAMVRYADDFVVLCRNRSEAEAALELIRSWVEPARLTLHPTKTHIVDAASEGFDFLGYHFERGSRWPRKKSLEKLKDKVRQKTKRTCGASIKAVVADLNRTLPGWFGYFQYSHWTTFRPLDAWIRMRLRSILRKHQKKRGRGGARIINAGQTPTLQSLGCSAWKPPMLLSVNPLCGELPTGEPYAGEPHVRFGGRGGRTQSAVPTPIGHAVATRPPPLITDPPYFVA
jgi:hypothetical protein